MITHIRNDIVKLVNIHSLITLSSPPWFQIHLAIKELRDFKSALKHQEWLTTIDNEIVALRQNNTWRLVP